MRSFIILGLAVLFLTLSNCSQTNNTQSAKTDFKVPELLQRSEAIQNGKEWENVQNIYTDAQQKVNSLPTDFKALLKLTEVFMTEARVTGEHGHYYPSALKTIDYVLENHKEIDDVQFRALSYKASVLLSQHEFEEALLVAKKATRINPYNASVYGALVDANVELGNYEEAVKMADKMISIRPDLRSYARVSYLREIHGQIDNAFESMQMAVAAGFPGYEETCWTRLTLGEMYLHYGHLEKAEIQFKQALKERENYSFAIAGLAEIAIAKKDYEKGEKLLKEACTIIPEVGFYMQLASLYKETGRNDEAQKLVPEIIEMLDDDVLHGHNMNLEFADLHLNLTEDYNKALSYTLEEYNKRPKNIDVNKLLVQTYLQMDNVEKAQAHLVAAISTGSKDPDLQEIEKNIALENIGKQKDLSAL